MADAWQMGRGESISEYRRKGCACVPSQERKVREFFTSTSSSQKEHLMGWNDPFLGEEQEKEKRGEK